MKSKIGVANTLHQCEYPVSFAISKNVDAMYHRLIWEQFEFFNTLDMPEGSRRLLFSYIGLIDEAPDEVQNYKTLYIGYPAIYEKTSDPDSLAYLWHRYFPQSGCMASGHIALRPGEFEKLPYNTMVSVVRHEIGHALGFTHSETKGDLMYPQVPLDLEAPQTLSPGELEAFRIYY
jgi:hypothetical protein